MITGIETIGLILAIYPVVIAGLEHYRACVETTKDWIRFRAEFTIFVNSLYRQKLFFRQNIEDLLSSVIESEFDMARMLDDLDDPDWKDPELEVRLKMRLSGEYEYECYMDIVSSFLDTLRKLESKLHVVSDQPSLLHLVSSAMRIDHRGLTYTLSKKRRQKLMSQLDKYNEDMKKLLGNSDQLEPMRKKRRSHLPKFFQQYRIQAASLHNAITKALRCNCLSPHSAELLLSRDSDKASRHSILDDSPEQLKLNLSFPLASGRWSSTSTLVGEQYSRYAAEVEMVVDNTFEIEPSELPLDNVSTTVSYGPKSVRQSSRKVSFLSTRKDSETSSVPKDAMRIVDICASLQNIDGNQLYLGTLQDDQERCHIIRTAANGVLSTSRFHQMVSLDSLLMGQSVQSKYLETLSSFPTIPRQKRLGIALTLARSLLQLHPGPWLKQEWSKKDIYFFRRSDGHVETNYPVLVCNFMAEKSSSEVTLTAKTMHQGSKVSLLSLGILVMELWFGQPIESLPFRKQFLGPDGAENEFTNFNTAQKWQEQTLEDGGLELHNITRRCIYCAFGAASQDLNDKELRRAVYDEVVQGLDRIVAGYEEG